MGTVHIAALFLPHTASFDAPIKEESPPPGPEALKRNSSVLGLASHISSPDLFGGPPAALTPNAVTDEALNIDPFGGDSRRNSRQLTLPGDSRRLLHSDADVPEWGSGTQLYNQPRSRAGPMPSRSVTDLRKLRKVVVEESVATSPDRETSPNAQERESSLAALSSGSGEYDNWTIERALRGNGALLHAIDAAISEKGLHVSWVGTLGFPTDALPKGTQLRIKDKLRNDYEEEVVYVSDSDFAGHYTNFCKVVLWPLFHYQVPDDVNSKAYVDHSWEYYYNVNRKFANKLIKSYKRGDTIWVHDYHLLLVPEMIREELPDAKIGFFLHTAFPSSEIFRCQMKYKKLLNGMLGANLVAFQLPEYVDHFFQTCSRFLRVEATVEGVQLEDRFVNVTQQAIGISGAEIDTVRDGKEFTEAVEILQEKYQGKQLIVARDKLDRVHGVRQKLLAYEEYLDQFPHRAENTVLLQLLAPSHEPNVELSGRISEIQNRINRKHGSLTQQPLVMYEQVVTPAQYYAMLTMGDAFINSTQRDGMNLTGHEFIYCQDGKVEDKKHGALILSEFAGSADILGDGVLRINPWSIRKSTLAIESALDMDADTKEAHWELLYQKITEVTGGHWFSGLNSKLTDAHKNQGDRSASSVPRLQLSEIAKAYDEADHRVFILDYEGTLIARQTKAGALLTSPTRVVKILNDLMTDPKNVVYVTSGSSPQQLSQLFQLADNVGLIAENGCYVREHRETSPYAWKTAVDQAEMVKWKSDVRGILEYFQKRLAGSVIEEMGSRMEFHFGGVQDKKIAERLMGDCADQINSSCQAARVRAVPTAQSLLIEQMDSTKATTASKLFPISKSECLAYDTVPPDFLMVAGDDREDEAVFRWANKLSVAEEEGTVRDVFSVSVGKRDTEAKAAMSKGSAGLLSVLEKLAEASLKDMPVKNPATKRSVTFDLQTS